MQKLLSRFKTLYQAGIELLYPRNCIACGCLVEGNHFCYLCTECARNLYSIRPPNCLTCGAPFYGKVVGTQQCPRCSQLTPFFVSGRSAILLNGSGKALIHELKYHHGLFLAADIRTLFGNLPGIKNFLANAILVPVPLHPRKQRERGFNQSYYIAKSLLPLHRTLTLQCLLRRTIDTSTQTRLNRQERQKNLKRAFSLKSQTNLEVNKKHIIIDDVFTTGATLNSCSQVLYQVGIRDLHVLTLAHG